MSREVNSGSIHRLCPSMAMAGFSLLEILDLEAGRERLLQLLGLLLVCDHQGVQKPGATDLNN